MQQNFNYHTHTWRCGHAKGTDEQYVQAAIDAGFKVLGFSDHGPYRNRSFLDSRMDFSQVDEYYQSCNQLKEKYKNQIDIKIGFELEYFDEYLPEMKQLRQQTDFLILGQHTSDMNCDYDFFVFNNDETAWQYCRLVEAGMDTGLFLYLAHPDCFCAGRRDFDQTCVDISHRLCAKAAQLHIPLEINLTRIRKEHPLAYKQGMFYKYPCRPFWEIASQYPVDVVYGYDAHNPTDLLDLTCFEKCDTVLGDLPLHYLTKPLI